MSTPNTEQTHPLAAGIETRAGSEALGLLLDGHIAAAEAVRAAIPALERGAQAMARTVRTGGKLVYAAAGASGTQAMADGLEITPTFGIPTAQIRILRAGGLEDMSRPKGEMEDRAEAAEADARAAGIGPGDCVICLAASGNTTYPVRIMEIARAAGAVTIGLANNPGARLLEADIAVLLATPPELIAGSTRLGAATAQKIALNMMSTLMGIRLGHVVDGLMVNVIANNEKLFRRAENIVMQLTGCDRETAARSLAASGGRVKEAVLITEGARDLDVARKLLAQTDGQLRAAIAAIGSGD
jgi:N-acetylmuramic acid 6-phosphate etherase